MKAERDIWKYFLLINYKTKERLLCSWSDNEPYFFGQKIHFIGINGLGGYNYMLSKGFIDRRFARYVPCENKIYSWINNNMEKLGFDKFRGLINLRS